MSEPCDAAAPSIDICPTGDELRPQIFALLPPGRSFQTNDGGPWPTTTLYGFFDAVAHMRAWFNERMCNMREEFFCATASETLDVWNAQYGLPDDCNPYGDLCAKVAAVGGQRCEYFQEVAARNGWTIACVAFTAACLRQFGVSRFGGGVPATADQSPRFGNYRFGHARGCAETYGYGGDGFGAADVNTLTIVVYTGSSPAYVAPTVTPLLFGRGRFGQFRACAENSIAPLQCLIERIAPAHALVVYRTQ
jgi:hypothetical protein